MLAASHVQGAVTPPHDPRARSPIDWRAERTPAPGSEQDQTHRRVLTVIERRIVEGSLRPGDRLPGERDLAEMLGVSRNSVREALRVLESMGIVVRGPGRGPGSGCIISGSPGQALSSLLRLHLALSHFSLADLVAVRVQLEAEAVRESARRDFTVHERGIQTLVEAMDDPSLSPSGFYQLDTQFHIALSRASGNPLLIALMQALRDAVQRQMVATSESLAEWPPVARRLRDEHAAIAEATRAGDGDRAAALLEVHILSFYGPPDAGLRGQLSAGT